MRHGKTFWTMALTIGLTLSTTAAGPPGGPAPGDELAPDPPRDVDRPPRLPRPIDAVPPTGDSMSFQLVGFTSAPMSADHGVLNYTLACQNSFVGSRICSASEIRRTVRVPSPPGQGLAWVVRDGSVAPSASTNCRDWTTTASGEHGTAVDFGNSGTCYGGFRTVGCDRQLLVACCALRPFS